MKTSSLVVSSVLSIACASFVVAGCVSPPGSDPFAGGDPEMATLGGGPKLPNGASPACLANMDVRTALAVLSGDRLTTGGTSVDGTPLMPSMPVVQSGCRHIFKDIIECALGDDQAVMDQDTGEVYRGQVGLATDWTSRSLLDPERRWVSACMIQRLNYFGISIPILLEGDRPEIAIEEDLETDYPFAESTAWGDIFKGSAGTFAWICTEEDVWSICPHDLGEPWVDSRVCDGVQDCGIAFAGRCSDACVLTAGDYWDCSAQYGFTETVRARMQTNTHPPKLGMCQ